ncbi:hypothetical protein D3C80_1706350 [compost metagenome]
MCIYGTAEGRQSRCAIGQIGHHEMQVASHPLIGRAQNRFVAIHQQQWMTRLDEGMGNGAPKSACSARNHDQTGHS